MHFGRKAIHNTSTVVWSSSLNNTKKNQNFEIQVYVQFSREPGSFLKPDFILVHHIVGKHTSLKMFYITLAKCDHLCPMGRGFFPGHCFSRWGLMCPTFQQTGSSPKEIQAINGTSTEHQQPCTNIYPRLPLVELETSPPLTLTWKDW